MRRSLLACAAIAAIVAIAPPWTSSASASPIGGIDLKAGYGRRAGDENRPVQIPGPDAQGNRIILNGLLASGSGLGGGLSGGVGDGRDLDSGLSAYNGSALANQINIVAQGSGNTIIVEAMQYNTGDIRASTR